MAHEKATRAPWCKHIDKAITSGADVISEDVITRNPYIGTFYVPMLSYNGLRKAGYENEFAFKPHPMFYVQVHFDTETHQHANCDVSLQDDNDSVGTGFSPDLIAVGPILYPDCNRKNLRGRFLEYFLDRALMATCISCEDDEGIPRPYDLQQIVESDDQILPGQIIKLLLFGMDVERNSICMACRKRTGADMVPAFLTTSPPYGNRTHGDRIGPSMKEMMNWQRQNGKNDFKLGLETLIDHGILTEQQAVVMPMSDLQDAITAYLARYFALPTVAMIKHKDLLKQTGI